MGPFKKPEVKLKINYRRTFELALIVSLLLHLGFFHMLPEFEIVTSEIKSKPIEIKVEDIPQTEQVRNLPSPPARPTMPIPTESEDIPEDVTIESTELQLDLSKIPPPPPPPEDEGIEERYVFVPYDEPPYPIGGYAAIQKNLKYPEIARKAGIEGLVIIGILIDEKGRTIKTQILKDSGIDIGFEKAAEEAVMALRWKPALQRDKPVKVWVSVPIRFVLQDMAKKITT